MPLDNEKLVKAPAAPTLADIEQAATMLAQKRRAVEDATRTAEAAMAAVWEKHAPALRRLIAGVATAQTDLMTLVTVSPHLFVRPRSITVDGLKVGWAKGKGKIEFDDEDAVIKLIRRKLSQDQGDLLITVDETVNKDALKQLDGADLARIGVRLADTSDAPYVVAVKTPTSKLLKSLLEEAAE